MNTTATRIDAASLMALEFPARNFSYDETRTMLYGLAAGMGRDPLDTLELPFVAVPPLRVLPSMATVVAWDDTWLPTDRRRCLARRPRRATHNVAQAAGAGRRCWQCDADRRMCSTRARVAALFSTFAPN